MSSRCILMGLLVVALSTSSLPAASEDETRKKIESLSADQLEQLRRNQERFAKMTPEEQHRIRELHKQLDGHKDTKHLTQVMEKYATWLRSLPAGTRAELLSVSGKERLKKMQKMIKDQEREQFMRLAADQLRSEDRETLFRWFQKLALARRDELRKVMHESKRARFDATSDPKLQSGMLVFELFANPDSLQVQKDEVEALLTTISPKARKALERVGTIDEKAELINDWIGILRASQMRRGLSPEPVPEEKLSAFYDSLDDRMKEYLRSRPAEQMKRDLERIYHARNWTRRFGGGGRGFRGGPRAGPGRGGFGGRRENGRREEGDKHEPPPEQGRDKRPPM